MYHILQWGRRDKSRFARVDLEEDMKKFVTILLTLSLAACMVVTAAACGNNDNPPAPDDNKSEYDFIDYAEKVYLNTEKYPELEADAAARYRGSLLWSLTEIALSDGDWSEQVRELRFALRKYHALFKAAPFTYSQDKIRLEVLTYLPFPVYRTLIRIKRRK